MRIETFGWFPLGLLWVLLSALAVWTDAKSTETITFPVQFCNGSLCSFQHLEYDSGDDKIYVGAINRIYQLDANLNSEKTAFTGPQLDSDTCYPHSQKCGSKKISSNNLNKLLKIDFDNRRIVACGSIKQGVCELRQLGNVTKILNDFSKLPNDPRTNDFVASTSSDQNTVAFIAKEGSSKNKKSLYVGASRTASDSNLITDDDQFPTFASRRMPSDNMDDLMFSSDLNKKEASVLLTKQEYADMGFRVNFISAFEGNQNGYFVLHYPKIKNNQIFKDEVYSYVAQVCLRITDSKSTTSSYLEIPISSLSWLDDKQTTLYKVVASTTAKVGSLLQNSLKIRNGAGENPDVLFASFATENGGGSTLAIFALYELDEIYYDIVKACLNGTTMHHVEWQREKALPCPKINFQVKKPLCDNDDVWDVVGLFQSSFTKQGYTVFESKDTVITSVAVTKHGRHTVAFMGTKDGKVLKLKIDSKPAGKRLTKPYEEIQIDSHNEDMQWENLGSPRILVDMRLNNDLTRLYVMSERKLVSLPLHDCSRFSSCFDCLNAGDPFCGWCTLDNKCTSTSECAKGQYTYAASDPSNCPKLTQVIPPALYASADSQTIRIEISNIPEPRTQGVYTCRFDGKSQSQVEEHNTHITCKTPNPADIPRLNGKEVSVPLSLYFTKHDGQPTVIASTEIVYYDCKNFKSCLPCLSSKEFSCHWCAIDNECHQKETPCLTYPGDVKDSAKCPRLVSVLEPPHIHQGKSKQVRIKAENLRDIKGKFFCQFSINGKVEKTVNASHHGEDILCGPIKGFLPPGKHEADARVDLYWKKNFVIDNPDSLNVTMYQCSRGTGDNCGKCLQLSKDLKCGWCEKKRKCMLCEDCISGMCRNNTVNGLYPGWLDQDLDCKDPEITDFFPKSAIFNGVTKITIVGKNLGTNYRKLDGGIKVVGERCNVISEDYIESERIKCVVRDVSPTINNTGKVELCIREFNGGCKGDDYKAVSVQDFKFMEPSLVSFDPYKGLYAGGTKITFKGKNLDIGNNVTVYIDGRNCPVDEESKSGLSITCKLDCDSKISRSRRHIGHRHHHHHFHHHEMHHTKSLSRRKRGATEATVKLVFDQKVKFYSDPYYLERDIPDNIPVDPKESITSGGMKLKVTGNHLKLAQSLVLEVSFEGHSKSRKCESQTSKLGERICYSPNILGYPIGNYSAKLIFDDCLISDIGHIRYTKDPYFEKFNDPDNIKQHQSGPIIIMGRNLCPNPLKCDIHSVKVDIGNDLSCNVTSIDKEKLVCLPPEGAGGKHVVTVHIGGYSQSVGELQFQSGVPVTLLAALISVVVLIVGGVLVAAFIVHKRAGKRAKEAKDQKKKYDIMEAKVAKECKEAFAELQTEMQSNIDNLCTVGIPFRKRHDYIMRVLFPEPEMYEKLNQVMHPYNPNNRFNIHNGRGAPHRPLFGALEEFDKLLGNKTFVLSFIYTLEQDRKFTMKDRSNVAGLLMIVLQNRLQHATSILERLLSELIRDIVESNNNPKLLLRRSESVAEKMLTHWFSILLHGFLLECSGEPLFTLYRAIKAQLDKGPVDAITGFAKYSLSQDKLLRQSVPYEQLVLIVVEHDSDQEMAKQMAIKVLDCDTITQTKEKIIAMKYRNQPQSQHPSPDDFDLEVNTEPLGRAILNDEDKTSILEGSWKKLNTLQHYEIKNKTVVTMVPKRPNPNPLNHSFNSNHSFGSKFGGMRYNGSGNRLINDGAGSLPRHMTSTQGSRSTTPTQADDGKRPYHLTKHHDVEPKDGIGDNNMMVSEIYLTRLLATKGTIQKFVDDLFETIFSVVQRGHALPLAIKHMFDFFDEQAEYHGITDPDVKHTWKSNSLPLRFWVNLIKNPEFLFDIKKSALVDSCLSVIAGTFMDSCSTADQNLGKDSPSGKLLYAKDVANYKTWVVNYYDEISGMPPLDRDDMQCFLRDESREYDRSGMTSQAALTELYHYIQKFNTEIIDALRNDPMARRDRLAQRLEQVSTTMTSTV